MEIWKNLSLEDMEGEIWKDVVGYEGLYQVSNLGRVKSFNYKHLKKTKILKQQLKHQGYLELLLTKDKISRYIGVHRLVAMAFISNPNNKPQVDHINTIRHDNRVENLRWATQSEQLKGNLITWERFRKNTVKTSKENIKKAIESNKRKVICVTTNKIFNSINEASEFYEIDCRRISDCCRGVMKQYKGLQWEYID